MKSIVELVGGLMLLFGGLFTLGLQGVQGLQATQATQAPVQALQPVQLEQMERKRIEELKEVEQAKTTEEYYDYKEEGEVELWEKMKAHYYKDVYFVRGGMIDE
jgi:hypothetical protein